MFSLPSTYLTARATARLETRQRGIMELVHWIATLDWRLCFASMVIAYVVLEQLSYQRKKRHLPGPSFVVPFLGNVISMVRNPTRFWEQQAMAAKTAGLSGNAVFGKFIVFIRDSELSQKVFSNVKPNVFHLVGHPFGKKLFGENNLIFMFGEEHKDLRRRLAPLFTLKALGVYVSIQEKTIRKHIRKWIVRAKSLQKPIALRILCRDMNLETSQNAFVGPYLSEEVREQFTKDYQLFNIGLMKLPINLPGFAFHEAQRAVGRLVRTLADCARESKKKMSEGVEPACLIDFWMVETMKEIRAAEAAGEPPPPHSSDLEIGQHIFDFLFAAQDASTSSLIWAVTLLEAHPEVLGKLRDEVSSVRPDPSTAFSPEQLRQMAYVEMVVKEVLRFRPPATLVPHIAGTDFPLTDTYTIPKGTIVFPSLFESSFQGFTDSSKFDPDRFSGKRQEDQIYKRNWLLFGAGPHQCLGQRYAINQLMLFTVLFFTTVECIRVKSPGCDDIAYVPTIVPKDDGLVYLSERRVAS